MRKLTGFGGVWAFWLCLLAWSPSVVGVEPSLENVAADVLPSIVKLSDGDGKASGVGSGIILDAQGTILTNDHVVNEWKRVCVTFSDGRNAYSDKIVRDPDTELAIVRLDASDVLNVKPATPADSDTVRQGQRVLAVGAPFDFEGSVTSGIISALHRRPGVCKYEDFLQTDASINPGNSGGGLFNREGQLVGVVTSIRSKSGTSTGVGFVVPTNFAKLISGYLLSSGRVPRGFFGVRTVPLTDTEKKQLGVTYGVKVVELAPNSDAPARKAGLQPGDVILKLAGVPVSDPQDFVFRVTHLMANRPVALYVLRNGQRNTYGADLVALTDKSWPLPAREYVKELSLWGQAITEEAGIRFGFAPGRVPAKGFAITDVEKPGLADEAGLPIGAVIQGVQVSKTERIDTGTAKELSAALTEARLKAGALLVVIDYTGRVTRYLVRK